MIGILLPARLRRWATIGFWGIVDLAPKTDQLPAFVDACYIKPYVTRGSINSKDSMLLARRTTIERGCHIIEFVKLKPAYNAVLLSI